MDRRRQVYRPEVVATLEDRLVLSAATVGLAAFEAGPQTRPVVVATFEGSDHSRVITRGGKPLRGQLTFSAREVALSVPSGGVGTAVGTFQVDYHDESSRAITSAMIVETLAPGLSYVPGSSHVPAGGQVVTATGPKGSQVLELTLPGGIAAGAEGYLEFQAEGVIPSRG